MGIRVKKALGYGLTNVKTEDHKMVDSRINAKSPLLTWDNNLTAARYLDFLRRRKIDGGSGLEIAILKQAVYETKRPIDPTDAVVWDRENGIPEVLLIRPLWADDWYRNDDIMDYVEETYLRPDSQAQANHVHKLRHGIYPFNGQYIDTRTGERVDQSIMTWIRVRYSSAKDGLDKTKRRVLMDALAQEAGFKNHAQAARYVAPYVPEEIRSLTEFGELFTSPDVIWQLRPMLYVWWS